MKIEFIFIMMYMKPNPQAALRLVGCFFKAHVQHPVCLKQDDAGTAPEVDLGTFIQTVAGSFSLFFVDINDWQNYPSETYGFQFYKILQTVSGSWTQIH